MDELVNPGFLFWNLLGPLMGGYLGISLGEHQLHRHLMHRKRLPKTVYQLWPYITSIFEGHAVRHHAQWYREFDFEPDECGKRDNLRIRMVETFWILVGFAPLFALLAWFYPAAAIIGISMTVLHNRLWNLIHVQMHMPQEVWFKRNRVFRFLARNHFMHHVDPRTHYNVVFPCVDYLMGTTCKPKLGHLREMMRLGYLLPRSARAAAWLDNKTRATEARRKNFLTTFVSSMTREEAIKVFA